MLIESAISRAIELTDEGEYDAAIEEFNSAIELDPSHLESYIGRAYLYYFLGQYEEALADVNWVLDEDSENAQAHWILGAILSSRYSSK